MTKRVQVSKSVRFEVFKRDGFKCQYCGAAAPDVVLEVDHVNPVAEGGTNELLNLVTACKPCNLGKGKRRLDDGSVLAKQREQLEELNERREQLEMMIRWKEELTSIKDDAFQRVCEFWSSRAPGYYLNESGRQELRRLTSRFGLDEIMDAMQIAADQYLEYSDGKPTQESVEKAWQKVSGICQVRRTEKAKPYIRDLFYIRGILRNRVYVNEGYVMELLETAAEAGVDVERMKHLAKTCRNWSEFRDEIHALTDELQPESGRAD